MPSDDYRIIVNDRVAYNELDAEHYRRHHRKNLRVRISTWRERQLAARALQRLPEMQTLLDLATGTGRFWPVVRAHSAFALAMDNSLAMLRVAAQQVPNELPIVAGSAFKIPLSDRSIDGVLCMRFMHHLYHAEDRMRVLQELHRVTRKGVVLSTWTNSHLSGANSLSSGERRIAKQKTSDFELGFGRRVCMPADVLESEYRLAGFRINWRKDFLPGLSMWRVYSLAVINAKTRCE